MRATFKNNEIIALCRILNRMSMYCPVRRWCLLHVETVARISIEVQRAWLLLWEWIKPLCTVCNCDMDLKEQFLVLTMSNTDRFICCKMQLHGLFRLLNIFVIHPTISG